MTRMNKKGTLIVYSGPSGVGKGTVLKRYLQAHPEAVLSVSMTTRAPRPGEADGVDYFYVTREAFEAECARGGLLEYAEYSGNYYGTPRANVEAQLAQGRDVILEIEVQGAEKIRRLYPDAGFVFVLPPTFEALRQRLVGRGTETPEVVERRLQQARFELSHARDYDFAIINDDVEIACKQLELVIAAAKCRTGNMTDFIEKVCECNEYA